MSSRNAYLDARERERASALRRALDAAETAVAGGERDPARVAAAARAAMETLGVRPEYLEIVSTQDLSPVAAIEDEALVAIAARVGRARLIDNTIVRVGAPAASGTRPSDTREITCNA